MQSDNEKIIKIVDGKAKAQGIGSATVTAFDAQGNSTKCKLTVKEEPDDIPEEEAEDLQPEEPEDLPEEEQFFD